MFQQSHSFNYHLKHGILQPWLLYTVATLLLTIVTIILDFRVPLETTEAHHVYNAMTIFGFNIVFIGYMYSYWKFRPPGLRTRKTFVLIAFIMFLTNGILFLVTHHWSWHDIDPLVLGFANIALAIVLFLEIAFC